MKVLSSTERKEVDRFANYNLSNKYEKCLSIGWCKRGNNINNAWQHVIFIYFYKCKTGRPTLIVFSKFPNIFIISRKCLKHLDQFCFVCGKFMIKEQHRNITHDIKKIYIIYFCCPLGEQDKTWAPHKIC